MDRMMPVILDEVGKCLSCRAVRCVEPSHLQHALARREEAPVISSRMAAQLIRKLTSGPGRITRARADQYMLVHYRVVG